MINLFIKLHKNINNDEEFKVFCIDSKSDWDPELKGKEPEYDIFLKFISEIALEIGLGEDIFLFKKNFKKIKDRTSMLKHIKKIDFFGEWLFIIIGSKKYIKIDRFISPYYLEIQGSYKYDYSYVKNAKAIIYLEIGIKYAEIHSCKLKEMEIVHIIERIAKKFNYNIVFEN